ncbi:MAG: hypothetical protein H6555_06335 [Lewinellaceae bacterium]|nr:hypothetical protein [Lewinellaceae bacterium]
MSAVGEIQNHQYPAVETYVNNANIVIDERNQESYHWITLKDGNNWLAENARFSFSGSSNADCSYCQTYGRLYSWDMALKACPKGWRLLMEKEWDNSLEVYGEGKLIESDGTDNPYTKYQTYQALESGLPSGLLFPLGGRMNSYGVESFESEGYYWSSSPKNSSEAWQYNFISYDGPKVNKYEASKPEAYSCRCIQE